MKTEALTKLNYGLYVVGSLNGDKINAQIANVAFQVTAEPVIVAVSINKNNLTHEYIVNSGYFSVSVININADFKFIGKFGFRSGRDIDKFVDVEYKKAASGVPIVLQNCSAWLELEVVKSLDMWTHTVFFGQLRDAEILNQNQPMTYDYYHKVIKGKSPKTAPTYIKK